MVSVVIPAVREATMLRRNLPLVFEVAGVREVVVAVPHGDDESERAARDCGAIVVASSRGRGPQMNAGAAATGDDVLLFLHADSWLDPGAAEEARRALDRPGVVAGVFRQRIECAGLSYRVLEKMADLRSRTLSCTYGDCGLYLRRSTFDAIGGFPDQALFEDLEMGRRLRRRGRIAVGRCQAHQSGRRWQRRGIARTILQNWQLTFRWWTGTPPERLDRAYYGDEAWYRDERCNEAYAVSEIGELNHEARVIAED